MVKKFLKFSGNKVEKIIFDSVKYSIHIDNVDIDKIIVSEMFIYRKNKNTDAMFS